jgi:large subunit ribosomal protein L5
MEPKKTQLHTVSPLSGFEKIVVGTGIGKLRSQAQFEDKVMPEIIRELSAITGQRPAPRVARKAISNFKTRVGDTIGFQVTLRGARMRDFATKLVHVVLPRVKDFRGIALTHVDEHGSLNIGFREHAVFPEIDLERSKYAFGVQVTLVPKTRRREDAIALYRALGVPFAK